MDSIASSTLSPSFNSMLVLVRWNILCVSEREETHNVSYPGNLLALNRFWNPLNSTPPWSVRAGETVWENERMRLLFSHFECSSPLFDVSNLYMQWFCRPFCHICRLYAPYTRTFHFLFFFIHSIRISFRTLVRILVC